MKHNGLPNGHATGIIMKELVRRAIMAIRNQKQAFEVQTKEGYGGQLDDMFTSADTAAQKVYIRSLQECFPGCGIIAEEDSLTVPRAKGVKLFFTVDPLDGTKAFIREQSHGVGTMVSLSTLDSFVAAYVGDVNTQEVYGFRPESSKAHRISEFSIAKVLEIKPASLKSQYVLLRDPLDEYSQSSRKLVETTFKSYEIDGGSIGTWMARLWKGEVGAVLFRPSWETPWDSNPITAISLKLGYAYLRPTEGGNKWMQIYPRPITKKYKRTHDVLVVHKNNLDEVLK